MANMSILTLLLTFFGSLFKSHRQLALETETASYPHAVQIWMKVMGASFLASLVFVRSKTGARWIFAALVLNIMGLVIGKIAFPDASRTAIGTSGVTYPMTCPHILGLTPYLLVLAGQSVLFYHLFSDIWALVWLLT
jgi:hypothetical protein